MLWGVSRPEKCCINTSPLESLLKVLVEVVFAHQSERSEVNRSCWTLWRLLLDMRTASHAIISCSKCNFFYIYRSIFGRHSCYSYVITTTTIMAETRQKTAFRCPLSLLAFKNITQLCFTVGCNWLVVLHFIPVTSGNASQSNWASQEKAACKKFFNSDVSIDSIVVIDPPSLCAVYDCKLLKLRWEPWSSLFI